MKKIKELFVNSFFYCLAIELVEEVLEELIAWGISSCITFIITKAISAIIVVAFTQTLKLVLKKIIKRITYKEGNDKVSKIKSLFTWIFANKKSLLGVASAGVATLSGTGVIDISILPTILVGGFDIAPVIYYGILLILSLLGICGKGFETIKQFFTRKESEKSEKQAKAILKEAKKEIATEQKLANQTQAEQEKAKAKAEEEKKAQEEKAKADAEHRAKVEEAKAKLIAEANSNEKSGA